ncbi:hypothetical protein [Streptomyces sp. NPDC006879]|uniref:hypothetical protein n=1 Tax=Streptomyces sp. NPDC006879 TaxID=3364767 RepID=UPI0036938908
MSTAATPGPRRTRSASESNAPKAKPKIDFDDPLDRPSADDSDRGWGDRPLADSGSAADLARFLDEKPPHHL